MLNTIKNYFFNLIPRPKTLLSSNKRRKKEMMKNSNKNKTVIALTLLLGNLLMSTQITQARESTSDKELNKMARLLSSFTDDDVIYPDGALSFMVAFAPAFSDQPEKGLRSALQRLDLNDSDIRSAVRAYKKSRPVQSEQFLEALGLTTDTCFVNDDGVQPQTCIDASALFRRFKRLEAGHPERFEFRHLIKLEGAYESYLEVGTILDKKTGQAIAVLSSYALD